VRNATRKFQNFREVHINRVHSNTADVSTVFRNKKEEVLFKSLGVLLIFFKPLLLNPNRSETSAWG
jgi:hypothetical protein